MQPRALVMTIWPGAAARGGRCHALPGASKGKSKKRQRAAGVMWWLAQTRCDDLRAARRALLIVPRRRSADGRNKPSWLAGARARLATLCFAGLTRALHCFDVHTKGRARCARPTQDGLSEKRYTAPLTLLAHPHDSDEDKHCRRCKQSPDYDVRSHGVSIHGALIFTTMSRSELQAARRAPITHTAALRCRLSA